jgi:hypothetical protein
MKENDVAPAMSPPTLFSILSSTKVEGLEPQEQQNYGAIALHIVMWLWPLSVKFSSKCYGAGAAEPSRESNVSSASRFLHNKEAPEAPVQLRISLKLSSTV